MYYAGIDGGQSATQAVVCGDDGVVLGSGRAGPADEIGATVASTRLRDALHAALSDALAKAKLPDDQRFAAIVAGVSGFEGRVVGVAPDLPSEQFLIMHDAPIAHAGALDGEPGIVVIAGTGSVAYSVDPNGHAEQFGGWGYLFGDQGSAFWIAREAIANITRHEACSATTTVLTFFGAESLRELVRAFYLDEISRERLATFAPVCIAAAQDANACDCLRDPARRAAEQLAKLANLAVTDTLRTVAFVGGLMRDAWFKEQTYGALQTLTQGVTIVEPQHDPVVGALLLARRL